MRLEDELAGSENRIAVARRRYNLDLQDYNTYVQQFPNSLWAGSRFPVRNEYFKGNPQNSQAPTVDFNTTRRLRQPFLRERLCRG